MRSLPKIDRRVLCLFFFLLLVVSVLITVYSAVYEQFELRRGAEEEMKTDYSARTIADWCPDGPYVEITATGASYDMGSGKQTLQLTAKRTGKIPVSEALNFSTSEVGCTNDISSPDMCNSCSSDDPGYYKNVGTYTIPAGQEGLNFEMTVNKTSNFSCGCAQQDIHIWVVDGGIQEECNTLLPRDFHNTHEYLYSTTLGGNCTTEVVEPTVTPSVPPLPTEPPTVPPTTANPTLTPVPTTAATATAVASAQPTATATATARATTTVTPTPTAPGVGGGGSTLVPTIEPTATVLPALPEAGVGLPAVLGVVGGVVLLVLGVLIVI